MRDLSTLGGILLVRIFIRATIVADYSITCIPHFPISPVDISFSYSQSKAASNEAVLRRYYVTRTYRKVSGLNLQSNLVQHTYLPCHTFARQIKYLFVITPFATLLSHTQLAIGCLTSIFFSYP